MPEAWWELGSSKQGLRIPCGGDGESSSDQDFFCWDLVLGLVLGRDCTLEEALIRATRTRRSPSWEKSLLGETDPYRLTLELRFLRSELAQQHVEGVPNVDHFWGFFGIYGRLVIWCKSFKVRTLSSAIDGIALSDLKLLWMQLCSRSLWAGDSFWRVLCLSPAQASAWVFRFPMNKKRKEGKERDAVWLGKFGSIQGLLSSEVELRDMCTTTTNSS